MQSYIFLDDDSNENNHLSPISSFDPLLGSLWGAKRLRDHKVLKLTVRHFRFIIASTVTTYKTFIWMIDTRHTLPGATNHKYSCLYYL